MVIPGTSDAHVPSDVCSTLALGAGAAPSLKVKRRLPGGRREVSSPRDRLQPLHNSLPKCNDDRLLWAHCSR